MTRPSDMIIPAELTWPAELTTQGFLDTVWQQRSLLMPDAWSGFQNPLSANELAGLAMEPDTTPRLILKSSTGQYRLEHGPFAEERFSELGTQDWSLLVTDVEKHLPELGAWLAPFRFLPGWRIDDLMISYAPLHASVGAHVDAYDVFLLQASGERRWQIDTRDDADSTGATEGDLRLLKHFNPNEEYLLKPGDCLYLPPGVPHHGIAASDNCMTWSIGFRAPSHASFVDDMATMLSEQLDDQQQRYRDPAMKACGSGEITPDVIAAFRAIWQAVTTIDDKDFQTMIGRLVTGGAGLPGAGLPGAGLPGAGLPGAGLPGAGLSGANPPSANPSSANPSSVDPSSVDTSSPGPSSSGSSGPQQFPDIAHIDSDALLACNPFCKFACLHDTDNQRELLFVDGMSFTTSYRVAQTLSTPGTTFSLDDFEQSDHALLVQLIADDMLLLVNDQN